MLVFNSLLCPVLVLSEISFMIANLKETSLKVFDWKATVCLVVSVVCALQEIHAKGRPSHLCSEKGSP